MKSRSLSTWSKCLLLSLYVFDKNRRYDSPVGEKKIDWKYIVLAAVHYVFTVILTVLQISELLKEAISRWF